MQPFPINRAWIPSVVAAVVIVGFLAVNRRGSILADVTRAVKGAPAGATAEAVPPPIPPDAATEHREAGPSDSPATAATPAPARTVGVAPVAFVVDVRPARTSPGASDVFVGTDHVGTLDRLGRAPCLFELTRLGRVAARTAESRATELRASVRAAVGTDQADAHDVLAAVTAAGLRGVSLDGAALFRGGTSAR
ncbi:MAG: hypothetical protein K8T90_02790 [Planctomycetes bacterium]|nr:hypothetical protein [Planctomycetota bacterium]